MSDYLWYTICIISLCSIHYVLMFQQSKRHHNEWVELTSSMLKLLEANNHMHHKICGLLKGPEIHGPYSVGTQLLAKDIKLKDIS